MPILPELTSKLPSFKLNDPLCSIEPVNLCVSSIVSPNIVEPLLNEEVIIETDDETIYPVSYTHLRAHETG